jgi:hypothetical protein
MPQHPPAGPYTTIPYGMQPVNPWGGAPAAHLHHGHHAAPARMPQTHEYQSTDKVRNQANLNKKSLKLVPVEGRGGGVYQLQFTFDASAACRVTTFVLGCEDPRQGCAITTSSSRVRQPVPYQPGVSGWVGGWVWYRLGGGGRCFSFGRGRQGAGGRGRGAQDMVCPTPHLLHLCRGSAPLMWTLAW